MFLREDIEKREYRLSPLAAKSAESKGRRLDEEPCSLRTDFQRDRDRIIHSKAFRRLMHKTQVFLSPEGDHYRTRLTHTLEVAQVARTITRALNLNEDLTEAIALGHDLGHTPFGHNGESILNGIHPGGFRHNEQSLRVVDVLESSQGREGMNLTYEVRDGILNHSGSDMPSTLEGEVVRISDRIAYINHDIDDALRSGVITLDDFPSEALNLFGERHSRRIDNMVNNVIDASDGNDHIRMDDEHWKCLNLLRDFMFGNIYRSKNVKKEEDLMMVEKVICSLYTFFSENPNEMPEDFQKNIVRDGIAEVVKDFVASMTDRYAINVYGRIFG
ncbi:MAG: deoxyguanosinetriphosphate triphosphohydrolase [Firmicutes bacterium]|nr:deoxyguanosinetriphosphate triphosphohydrolase [Bacillota bacterium]